VIWGLVSGHKVPWTAEETNLGQWWVLAEVCHLLWKIDPPCHSCTVQ
jgi:hypothetical protein